MVSCQLSVVRCQLLPGSSVADYAHRLRSTVGSVTRFGKPHDN